MKSAILLISALGILSNALNSQNIYIVKANDEIHEVLPDGNLEYKLTVQDLAADNVLDIAISPSNKLYGMTPQNGIIEINWETGEYETISSDLYLNASSLVCANENELYYLSNSENLFKYDISLDLSTLIAAIGHDTPGDICIHKRNIIFPTLYDIKAYNLDTEELSTVFCFPDVELHYGISTMPIDCDSSTILLSNYSTLSNPDFIKVNLESGISTPIEGGPNSSVAIYGMASNQEFSGMTCDSWEYKGLDCDQVVSTANIHDLENHIDVYPNPVSQFLTIQGCDNSYRLKIYDSKGVLLDTITGQRGDIDMSRFNSGIYYLSILCGNTNSLHKIIKY